MSLSLPGKGPVLSNQTTLATRRADADDISSS
jgi:hypothetical protein